MRLERILYYPLQTPMTGIFSAAVGGAPAYAAIISNSNLASYATFTRASDARYTDSAGVLQTATSNVSRKDYNPSTLVLRGLLIEEAATNICLRSEEFDNASWVKTNTTVTANTVAGADGTTTTDTLAATAANATTQQTVTTTAAPWIYSVWLRRKTGTGNVDITMDGTTWVTRTLTTTLTRFEVAQTCIAGSSNPGIRIVTSGDEVYAWGAQVESSVQSLGNSVASSYIVTVAASATRAADQFKVTGAEFTNIYNAAEFTLYTDFSVRHLGTTEYVAVDDTTVSELAIVYQGGGTCTAVCADGAVTQSNISPIGGTTATDLDRKLAAAYKLNDFAVCQKGVAVVTDVVGTMPTCTQFRSLPTGVYAGAGMNGWFRDVRLYKRRVPDAELQTLTAP